MPSASDKSGLRFPARWRRRIVLRAFAIGVVCTGCQSLPEISHKAVFTPHEQSVLGAVALSELAPHTGPSSPDEQTVLVRTVGERLAKASGRDDLPWEFQLVRSGQSRVVALPGGKVVVSEPLLMRCRSEAELAAAMAREIGCMLAGLWPREITALRERPGEVQLTIDQLSPAERSAKDPEALCEADSIALSLLVRAGYDPEAARAAWFDGHEGSTTPSSGVLPTDSHERWQSFEQALEQARAIYAAQPNKLGTGRALVFDTSSTTLGPHSTPTPSAGGWTAPRSGPTSQVTVSTAGVTELPTEHAEVDASGEFLPPSSPDDSGTWSSAAPASTQNQARSETSPATETTSASKPNAGSDWQGPRLP